MQQIVRNPYLCLTIVWLLGALSIISTLGIILISGFGREPSSALISIASGSMCALASFLVMPPRGSAGYDGITQPAQAPPGQQVIVSPQGDGKPHVALPQEPHQ